jgi:8-oxo-dGTP pyrophosphatase MutT (NUDIX family)
MCGMAALCFYIFVKLPAGMVDGPGNFKGVAAKETKEELSITIREDELTCLSDPAEASRVIGCRTMDEKENLVAAISPVLVVAASILPFTALNNAFQEAS